MQRIQSTLSGVARDLGRAFGHVVGIKPLDERVRRGGAQRTAEGGEKGRGTHRKRGSQRGYLGINEATASSVFYEVFSRRTPAGVYSIVATPGCRRTGCIGRGRLASETFM